MSDATAPNIKKYSDVIGGIEDFMMNAKDTTIMGGVKILQSVYLSRLQQCLSVINATKPIDQQKTFPNYLRDLAAAFEATSKGS